MTRELDQIDLKLISLLREDGRAPAASLARELDLDARTVRRRIDALRRDGVLRISGIVDPAAVGHPVIVDISLDVDVALSNEVAYNLVDNPLVSYVALPFSGGTRVYVQVRCRDNDQLGTFLNETISTIPGIQHVSFSIIHHIIKDVFDWDIPD